MLRLRAENRTRRTGLGQPRPRAGLRREGKGGCGAGVRFCKLRAQRPGGTALTLPGEGTGNPRGAPQPPQRGCPPAALLGSDAIALAAPALSRGAQSHLSSSSRSLRGSREAWPAGGPPL